MAKLRNEQDRLAHVLRRFAFGASERELAAYHGLTVEQAIDRLLNPSAKDEPLDPIRFAFVPEKDAQPTASRFRGYWVHHMLVTDQPLREKAALFWHNHFATSEEKTNDGLAMLEYMQAIRRAPLGSFKEILRSMVTSVAVMKQLDVQMLNRANPNENFARELLELYTLGVGHYTEKDIKELAHMLTGHGYIDIFNRLGKTNEQRLLTMLKNDTWGSAYCYAPALHDDSPRTILGTQVHSFDQVLEVLTNNPRTAEFVCTKLWKFFGSASVSQPAVATMVKAWRSTGGHIGTVLKAMTKTREFWSDDVVRALPKNPVDFVVGIGRAQGVAGFLRHEASRGTPLSAVSSEATNTLGDAITHIRRIGFDLMYIPSVAGYEGGATWISSDSMLRKSEFHGVRTYEPYTDKTGAVKTRGVHPLASLLARYKAVQPTTSREAAELLCRFYDATLTDAQIDILAQVVEKNGGMKAMPDGQRLNQLQAAFKFLRMTPDFSLC